MNTEQASIEDNLVEFVRLRDWVTFVEIANFLRTEGMETKGIHEITARENLIIWTGMSEQFSNLIMCLIRNQRIFPHPSDRWSYFLDGDYLDFPIAKRMADYKKPHWIPIAFRTTPMQLPKQTKQKRVRASF
jgi:hypothetical protein